MIFNTGTPRSIAGHALSGGIIAFMVSGAYEYSKVKQGAITQKEAIKNAAVATIEGGVITACGIAAANALGSTQSPFKNVLEAAALVGIGLASVYGIQALANPKNSLNPKS
ncbi:hypothetical protein [Helicobacter sp. MIT 05-5294]|uniref:hypothetical protein n=1 Tax=Helicobacter sp. MIT 05-5294 TaxID=1548150 RepID=UPI000A488F4D|nr:hypothetical protein [Helicobacter sp. MIT 05-5294]TLD87843.1 hypothetical protein LS69_003370 [Helicobacter sp. MIT 05-5294]